MSPLQKLARRLTREEGFTMLFALLALFVGSLLVAAAFTAANGDIKLTHRATLQQKAYYAALAGVDRYQYQLTSSAEYWTKCPTIGTQSTPQKVTGTTDESYYVKTLGANGYSSCESGKQATILETSGAAKGTFRILSTGTVSEGSSTVTRKIVATFTHPGFTKYVYESNYEVEDPVNFGLEASVCEHYYSYRKEHNLIGKCPPIQFAPEDEVNGPMHTNDSADVCASSSSRPRFGREGHNDAIEMNGGHYSEGYSCSNNPNIVGTYTESAGSVLPPETDVELLEAAGAKYDGRTEIELKAGSPNTMQVTNKGTTKTVTFPSNGVVYVENSKTEACAVTSYTPFGTDTTGDGGCGNVYVHGTYSESLTIASADDVIVNGNLTTTSEASGEPTGAATLGLIAENFVRVYHPVKESIELEHYEPKSEAANSEEIAYGACGTGFVKRTGTLVSEKSWKTSRKEIEKLSSTSGLSSGMRVTGTYIPSGTEVTSVKSSTATVELSEYPTKSGVTEEVLFYKPLANGYEYVASLKRCVEPPKSGYTYHESENLDVKGSCESGTEYVGEGVCKIVFGTGSCSSKATNLSAAEDPNHWGVLESPVIDAAILSTNHSWIVDNYKCGAKLGTLTVWGSIAQFWRGPVGTGGSSGSGTGYIKSYNYDDRLANQQPPSFLSPTSASSWKISRETAPPATFTG